MAYVVLESGVRTHRKMLAAGPAACWLWVCGNCYCQEGLTDGHIPDSALPFLGVPAVEAPGLADTLVRERLWDRVDDGWRVHDYFDHNKSAEEVRRIMRARAEGGRKGGRPPKTSKDNLQGIGVSENLRNLPRNPSGTSGTSGPTTTTTRAAGIAPPPSATAPSAAVLVFPTTGQVRSWALTEAYLAELSEAYDTLDVRAECRQALAWVNANPNRKKTANGMQSFLVSWLSRSANDRHRMALPYGASKTNASAKPLHTPAEIKQIARAVPGSWAAECIRLHDGRCGGPNAHHERMEAAS